MNLTSAKVALNCTGTATASTINVSNGTTRTPTVSLSGLSGNGNIGITIQSASGTDYWSQPAPASAPSTTFLLDTAAPTLSIGEPSTTGPVGPGGSVTYTVTYVDPLTGGVATGIDAVTLAASDITLVTTGGASGVVSVSETGNATRTITISNVNVVGGDGTGTIAIDEIAAGTATDAAGNAAAAVTTNSTAFNVDRNVSTVSFSSPTATIANTGPVSYTVTYSYMNTVTLAASQVTLNRTGTASASVSVSGTAQPNAGNSYTVTRTITLSSITGDGTLSLNLPSGTAKKRQAGHVDEPADAAGPSDAILIDNTKPTVTVSDPNVTKVTSSVSFTVTYADPAAGSVSSGMSAITLAPANITLNTTNTATGTVTVSGSGLTTRTVTINGITGDGTLGITLNAGTAVDAAGNATNATAASTICNVLNSPVTVSIGAPDPPIVRGGPLAFDVTYSAGVGTITLAPSDVTINMMKKAPEVNAAGNAAGTVSDVQVTGVRTRRVIVSDITGDGMISISIPASTGLDYWYDPIPPAPASPAAFVDNVKPVVIISSPNPAQIATGSVSFTLTYADPPGAGSYASGISAITLAASDISINKTGTVAASVGSITSSGPTTRIVTLTGVSGDGWLGISVGAGTGVDAAGNTTDPAGPSTRCKVQNNPPSINISAPIVPGTPPIKITKNAASYTVTYTGMANVTLAPGDVTLHATGTASGTISVTGSGTSTRTVAISGIAGDGTLGISIASGTGTDYWDQGAPASGMSATFIVDNTAPAVTVTPPSDIDPNTGLWRTRHGPLVFTVDYAELHMSAITLAASSVQLNTTGTVTVGSVTVDGTGLATRTVTLSDINGDGAVGIRIPSETAIDHAGNLASASPNSATMPVDNTPPTIAVSGPTPIISNRGPVTYTVTYGGADEISLTPSLVSLARTGTATAAVQVAGSGLTTRTITLYNMRGDGTIIVNVQPNSATDKFGNVAPAASSGVQDVLRVDNTKPVILLNGSETVNIEYTDCYTDAGATAFDDIDGEITDRIVTVNPVDTLYPESITYSVRYNVSDTAGNAADEVVRTVIVSRLPKLRTIVNLLGGTASYGGNTCQATIMAGRLTGTRTNVVIDRAPRFAIPNSPLNIECGLCFSIEPETTFVFGNFIGTVTIWYEDDGTGNVKGSGGRVPISTLKMVRKNGRTGNVEIYNGSKALPLARHDPEAKSFTVDAEVWGLYALAGAPNYLANPDADTDRDGILDIVEDDNHDGLWSHVDTNFPMRWPYPGNETDWMNWDTDGDGVSDGVEIALGTNPLDPNSPTHAGGTTGVPVTVMPGLAALAAMFGAIGLRAMRRKR
ncbi:MAG TPA: DUF5011 domain-containing protein [Candidatus Hydrogenedentes bacterium]|nr:DUF5011 domain-containing protein [Candidatus Hydrogenedentota bacterium]